MSTLAGKTLFITGASRGIGHAIAVRAARDGANVVIAAKTADPHPKLPGTIFSAAEDVERAGGKALPLVVDVRDEGQVEDAVARAVGVFGGIDILVNNAGVGLEGPLLQATYADYDFGFGVNIGGVVNGFVNFMPQMIAHGRGGHIVSTASLAAEVVMPAHLAIYAASKAAVCHYCEAVKAELGTHGIGVSILLPGPIKSNIHQANQNRPEHLRSGSGFVESEQKLAERQIGDTWMEPEEVGNMVADGILADSTYIVTHGIFKDWQRARSQAVLDATPDVAESAVRGI